MRDTSEGQEPEGERRTKRIKVRQLKRMSHPIAGHHQANVSPWGNTGLAALCSWFWLLTNPQQDSQDGNYAAISGLRTLVKRQVVMAYYFIYIFFQKLSPVGIFFSSFETWNTWWRTTQFVRSFFGDFNSWEWASKKMLATEPVLMSSTHEVQGNPNRFLRLRRFIPQRIWGKCNDLWWPCWKC